jgi:protein-tyrosine phosphatase
MSADWELMQPEFEILVVCTANICRSPLAERLLQAGFDDVAPGQFAVSSAGTQGRDGWDADPYIAELAVEHGVHLEGFTSRQVEPGMIQDADLVLAMTREHRRRIVEIVPAAVRRTFTLREFARLLPSVPPEAGASPAQRWHSLAALAQRHRRAAPGDQMDEDIIDPYQGPEAVYRQMLEQLLPAVQAIFDWERRSSGKET